MKIVIELDEKTPQKHVKSLAEFLIFFRHVKNVRIEGGEKNGKERNCV